jgi:hypothetical protein
LKFFYLNLFRAPKHGLKISFAECFTLALGKEAFAGCFFLHSAKKLLCREPFIGRSAKPSLPSAEALPSVFYLARGKAFFAERPKKNARQSLRHSTKKRISVVVGVLSPLASLFVGR